MMKEMTFTFRVSLVEIIVFTVNVKSNFQIEPKISSITQTHNLFRCYQHQQNVNH